MKSPFVTVCLTQFAQITALFLAFPCVLCACFQMQGAQRPGHPFENIGTLTIFTKFLEICRILLICLRWFDRMFMEESGLRNILHEKYALDVSD